MCTNGRMAAEPTSNGALCSKTVMDPLYPLTRCILFAVGFLVRLACALSIGSEGIELIKCLEKKGAPDKAFEEVKDKVNQMFTDDKFNTMID